MIKFLIIFWNRLDGEKAPMACFAGQRGPTISRSLLEIEATFEKHLNVLHSVKKGILDVKNTSWHDDYNRCCVAGQEIFILSATKMHWNVCELIYGNVYSETKCELYK